MPILRSEDMTKFKKLWNNTEYSSAAPIMDRRRLQDVLAGDTTGLMLGLHWSRTPQGGRHWSKVYEGQKKLSKRSRRYLNKLLSA